VPFTFDRGGGVATTTDPDLQVRQHVEAWLRTFLGERVIKVTFGNDLISYVFENINNADLAAIQGEISAGFDTWIPSARLVKLVAVDQLGEGANPDTILITLNYARRYDSNPVITTASIPVVTQ
jgi:phage baseplate assembly protein W